MPSPASASRPGSSSRAASSIDRSTSCCCPGPGAALDQERGLATLPAPSPNDLFFDIEGDPYAFDDGLDYLFGVLEANGTFHAFWSREADGEFTLAAEQRAFEQLMDFFGERLAADPTLHIYHYAPYEPTALKRLMGRYGTREDELDGLLRHGVLVDLLRAVRQSLRASVESYSIKKMEPFYGFEREVDLRDAGSSIVAFEQWLELGEGERPEATHLERIERYNRDDVVSNQRLRDWLEERRGELRDLAGQEVPRPAPRVDDLPTDLTEAQARVQGLVDRLAGPDVPADPADRTAEQHAPLASRPAPRLAPARGQVDVVGLPPAHGPHAGAARRRERPDRDARTGRADR